MGLEKIRPAKNGAVDQQRIGAEETSWEMTRWENRGEDKSQS